MLFAGHPVQDIGQTGVEIDLDQDRYSKHGDDQRLGDDLFPLKAKEQTASYQLCDDDGKDDVQNH